MIADKFVDLYVRNSGLRYKLVAKRDVVLTYALRAMADAQVMEHLAFKGGTCLRKLIFGSMGRFSEDLDFTIDTGRPEDDVLVELVEVLNRGQVVSGEIRRRSALRFRAAGRCRAHEGGAGEATEPLRAQAVAGQDTPAGLSATAEGPQRWQGSGQLRLSRLHALLAQEPEGSVAAGMEDAQEEPPQGNHFLTVVVQGESAHADTGAARRAHAPYPGALQLLRGQRQPQVAVDGPVQGGALLVSMAQTPEPADADDLEALQRDSPADAASQGQGLQESVGYLVRRIGRRAGWWKSPCPDLVGAPAERSAGATRHPGMGMMMGSDPGTGSDPTRMAREGDGNAGKQGVPGISQGDGEVLQSASEEQQ